jgi:nucleoside-diphosphate-sugar epimerase
VDDIARGTVAALKGVGHEIINLGSDSPVVLLDVVRLLEDLLDRPARLTYEPAHPADVPATWADIGKARRILGWRPRTTIEEGARAMIEWYLENRELVGKTVA